MTSTTMCIRSETQTLTQAWQKLFLVNPTINSVCSIEFMKRLMLVSVSCIAYSKKMLSNNDYTIYEIENMKIPVLEKNVESQLAKNLLRIMKSTHEGINNQWLKYLIVAISDERNSDIVNLESFDESYIFKFKYNHEIELTEKKNFKFSSIKMDSISSSTLNFLNLFNIILDRNISLYNIHKQPCMSIILKFNKNVTPSNYVADGFYVHSNNMISNKQIFLIDRITTPYNELKIGTQFKLKGFTYMNDESVVNSDTEKQSSSSSILEKNNSPPIISNEDNLQNEVVSNSNYSDSEDSSKDIVIHCPCRKSFGSDNILKCKICGLYQHHICFGLFKKFSHYKSHVCDTCALNTKETCTDVKLMKLAFHQKKSLCLLRHALELCCNMKSMNPSDLVENLGISKHEAHRLIDMLKEDKVFNISLSEDYGPTPSYDIDKNNLPTIMKKYFMDFELSPSIEDCSYSLKDENNSESSSDLFKNPEKNTKPKIMPLNSLKKRKFFSKRNSFSSSVSSTMSSPQSIDSLKLFTPKIVKKCLNFSQLKKRKFV